MSDGMKRTDSLKALARHITDEAVVVAIGGLIDEWAHILHRDLNYYSGGMGLAASIGLGLSLAQPKRKVIVLDGDGGLLMNLGSFATTSGLRPPNFLHLIFNNGTYESSGNIQLPGGDHVRFSDIASGSGVGNVREVSEIAAWREMIPEILTLQEHTVVVLRVVPGDSVPLLSHDRIAHRFRFQEALK